jgi:hypothetical protein
MPCLTEWTRTVSVRRIELATPVRRSSRYVPPRANSEGPGPGGPGRARAAAVRAGVRLQFGRCRPTGSFSTYLFKFPGYSKQSSFSSNELFLPLFLNPGNVSGARCNVGGEFVGLYLLICDKNTLQRYVDWQRSGKCTEVSCRTGVRPADFGAVFVMEGPTLIRIDFLKFRRRFNFTRLTVDVISGVRNCP